jgi:hypothetical protein
MVTASAERQRQNMSAAQSQAALTLPARSAAGFYRPKADRANAPAAQMPSERS